MAIAIKDDELRHIEERIASLQKYEIRGKIGSLQGYLSPHYRRARLLGKETLLVNLTMLQPTSEKTFDIITACDVPFSVLKPVDRFTMRSVEDKTVVTLDGDYVLYNPRVCSRLGLEHHGQRARLTKTLAPMPCRVDYNGIAANTPEVLDKLLAEFFTKREGDLTTVVDTEEDEEKQAFLAKLQTLPTGDIPWNPLVVLQEMNSRLLLMTSIQHLHS